MASARRRPPSRLPPLLLAGATAVTAGLGRPRWRPPAGAAAFASAAPPATASAAAASVVPRRLLARWAPAAARENVWRRAEREDVLGGSPLQLVVSCSFWRGGHDQVKTLIHSLGETLKAAREAGVEVHLTSISPENPTTEELARMGLNTSHPRVHAGHYSEIFDLERMVALTPDADEDLEDVEGGRVYLIGGISGKKNIKGQSLEQAREAGVRRHRRLPLKKHGPKGLHPVLRIQDVVRILAAQATRGNWTEALTAGLPTPQIHKPRVRLHRDRRPR